MKYRCPYCKGLIEGELHAECPHCHKTMNIPADLRPSSDRRERKRAKERIHRQAELERRKLNVPQLGPARKPSHVLLALAAMVVAGGLLVGRVKLRGAKYTPEEPPENVAQRELDILFDAAGRFRTVNGRYPTTAEGTLALINNPGLDTWTGPYVTLIKPDPWGRHYLYRSDGTNLTLFSLGPDGAANTLDDLQPAASAKP